MWCVLRVGVCVWVGGGVGCVVVLYVGGVVVLLLPYIPPDGMLGDSVGDFAVCGVGL